MLSGINEINVELKKVYVFTLPLESDFSDSLLLEPWEK